MAGRAWENYNLLTHPLWVKHRRTKMNNAKLLEIIAVAMDFLEECEAALESRGYFTKQNFTVYADPIGNLNLQIYNSEDDRDTGTDCEYKYLPHRLPEIDTNGNIIGEKDAKARREDIIASFFARPDTKSRDTKVFLETCEQMKALAEKLGAGLPKEGVD